MGDLSSAAVLGRAYYRIGIAVCRVHFYLVSCKNVKSTGRMDVVGMVIAREKIAPAECLQDVVGVRDFEAA